MSNPFSGMSMLREKEEKATGPKSQSDKAMQLQNYLAQQYGAGPAAKDRPKKKKKVKKSSTSGAVRIVDDDVTGFGTNHDYNTTFHSDNVEGELVSF